MTNNNLLIVFILLNAANVIIQTVKSLCTINGGKLVAATANAVAYGLYTVVVVYMVCELPLLWKVIIIGTCNFIGVFIVKWFEEKARKDKLWKIELTILNFRADELHKKLEAFNIPHNYIPNVGKWTLFNCYCATKEESSFIKKTAAEYRAKFFVNETKNL